MDSAANIIDAKFCRSVIRSVASLTYDQAQAMLDIPDTQSLDDSLESKIINSVKALNVLARQLKQQRINEGALTLASPEVRFKFEDENSSNPTDVTEYAIKESHQLVEEFMLLANITGIQPILPTHSVSFEKGAEALSHTCHPSSTSATFPRTVYSSCFCSKCSWCPFRYKVNSWYVTSLLSCVVHPKLLRCLSIEQFALKIHSLISCCLFCQHVA